MNAYHCIVQPTAFCSDGPSVATARLSSAPARLGILSYKYGSERLIERLRAAQAVYFGQKGKFPVFKTFQTG